MDRRDLINSGDLVEFKDGGIFLCIENKLGKFLVANNGIFDIKDFNENLEWRGRASMNIVEIYEIKNTSVMMSPFCDKDQFLFYRKLSDDKLTTDPQTIRKLNYGKT